MKGITYKINEQWFVEYNKAPFSNKIYHTDKFPIYKPEEHTLNVGDVVEFRREVIDNIEYAKLKYPIPQYDPFTGEKNPFFDEIIM